MEQKQYLIQFYATIQGNKLVVNSMREMERSLGKTTVSAKGFGMGIQKAMQLAGRSILIIPIWFAMRQAFMALVNTIQDGVRFMIEWEYQLAQVRIVGNATERDIQRLSKALLDLASSLGISYKQMGEGAKLWAQQGRSISEIIPLMESTAKLSMLTGRSMTQSVEDLTAVMKAYNIEASQSISIVDSITNVMLNHAITAGTLVSALKEVSAVAEQFNVSFEQMQGIITATHVVTRSRGSRVGLAWRTIFARIATSAHKAIVEIAKIPVFLDENGKASMVATNNMRDLGVVLDELAMKWNELSMAQRAQLGQALAGKRRITELMAFMGNFDEAIEAEIDALFGAGKSMEATNIFMDTMKHKAEGLSQSWHTLVSSLSDTRGLKSATDALSGFLRTLIAITDPVASSYDDIIKGFKETEEGINKQVQSIDTLVKAWQMIEERNAIFERDQKKKETWSPVYFDRITRAMRKNKIELAEWVEDWDDLVNFISTTAQIRVGDIFKLDIESEKASLRTFIAEITKDINKTLAELATTQPRFTLTFLPVMQDLKKALATEDILPIEKLKEFRNRLQTIIDPERFGQRVANIGKKGIELTELYIEKLNEINNVEEEASRRRERDIKRQEEQRILDKQLKTIKSAEQAEDKLREIELKGIEYQKTKLEIQKEQLEYLKNTEINMTDALERQKENLEISVARENKQKEINRLVDNENLLLQQMRLYGASELQIEIQRLAFIERRKSGEQAIYDQKKKISELALQTLQQEQERLTSLYIQYQKSDMFERGRLRRMMELRQLSDPELARRYETDMFDRRIIEQYWSHFSSEGQQAVGEVIRRLYELPEAQLPGGVPDVPESLRNIFSPEVASRFWDTWQTRGTASVKQVMREWNLGALVSGGVVRKEPTINVSPANIDFRTDIARIEINLPEDSLDRMVEETANQVKDALLRDEELQRTLARLLRELI